MGGGPPFGAGARGVGARAECAFGEAGEDCGDAAGGAGDAVVEREGEGGEDVAAGEDEGGDGGEDGDQAGGEFAGGGDHEGVRPFARGGVWRLIVHDTFCTPVGGAVQEFILGGVRGLDDGGIVRMRAA